jgi:glycosyltransferase involved in cell wall biosynthesis
VRVAVVTPRYGEQIVGGAEASMRMLAERLVSRLSWKVEALTTCSSNYMTWDDDLPAGESVVNGVRVRRFGSLHGRTAEFDFLTRRLFASPASASMEDCERWIELQGPRSPELIEAVAATDADVVVFCPYLYYPTVRGIDVVARRSIFHPAAHDETPIYLPVFRDTFMAAAGLVFLASWERGFVQRLFAVAGRPQLTLGVGVDDPGEDVAPATLSDGRPYLCCIGRVDAGKGTSVLAEMFAAYKAAHPGPLQLVMVGPVVIEPPPHPDILMAGQVDEAMKWSLIDGSLAIVAPSPYESFLIVLLEAWTRRRPVIVNGDCAATSEQCRLSGGGLPYHSQEEFSALVEQMIADQALREELGAHGRAFVDERYRWPELIDRWARFAEQIAERAA